MNTTMTAGWDTINVSASKPPPNPIVSGQIWILLYGTWPSLVKPELIDVVTALVYFTIQESVS